MPDRIALEASIVAKEIEQLFAAYPDLADDDALRADMVEGSTDFAEIMSRVLDHEREAKGMLAAIKKRAEDLTERRQRWERRVDAMRSLMLNLMSAADQQKVVLPEATISIAKGRETVEVTDVDALPQGFYSLERKADRIGIMGALMAGEVVPGAALRTGDAGIVVRAK